MKGEINMEKYGTIPKRFTKDWWAYFWDYYKIHTIATGVVVVLVGTTGYQCATQTKYDLSVSYVGTQVITPEMESALVETLAGMTDETTGNNNKDVFLLQYNLSGGEEAANAEYEYAMSMKLAAEMQAGEADIYIASGSGLDTLKGYGECFMDISAYAGGDVADDMLIKDENGRPFAVSLKGNSYFADAGIDSSDMYIAVRDLFEANKDKKEYAVMHDNSLKVASFILGE